MPDTAFSLDGLSLLLVWTAIAIYVLAFAAYTVDLARRSDLAVKAKDAAPVRQLVAAGAVASAAAAGGAASTVAGSVSDRGPANAPQAGQSLQVRPSARPRYVWARIGTALAVLGFLFHVGGDVTRGISAGRVPWANLYEFALTGTMLVIAVYLAVLVRYDLRFLGAFVSGLVVVLLGGATINYYVAVAPLPDALKSIWLVIHVFVASLATAFLALAFALSVVQLLQSRRERIAADASRDGAARGLRFLRTLPNTGELESLAYRFAIVGFIFWTFTLIAGAIWANDAWGRYWGFDTKEVWTFVIWVLYAGYIHARATRGWRGTRSAWLSIVAFAAVLFNTTIVNTFFKGLHAYSGLN